MASPLDSLSWLDEEPPSGPTLKVPGSPGYEEQFAPKGGLASLDWLDAPATPGIGVSLNPPSASLNLNRIPGGQTVKEGTEGFLRGANEQIAKALGFPADVVLDALYLTGLSGDLKPGDAGKKLIETFNKLGIRTPQGAERMLSERIGAEAVNQAIMGAATLRAAPTLQSVGGVTGEVGKVLADKPVTAMVASATSAPGAVMGGDAGSTLAGKGAELLGASPEVKAAAEGAGRAVGAIVGGAATAIPGTTALRSLIPDAEKGGFKPYQRPLMDPDATPSDAVASAQRSVERSLAAVDRRIVQTIERVNARRLSPAQASTWLRDSLENTYTAARQVEEAAWNEVPRNHPIDMAPVWQVMQDQLGRNWEGAIPREIIQRVQQRAVQLADDGTVTGVVAQPFHWVRQLRSDILRQRWEAGGSVPANKAPNRDLQGALADIEDAIMASISRSLPDSAPWERARVVSQAVNDRFTRGPIGRLLSLDKQAQDRIPAELTAKEILDNPGGVAGLRAATQQPLTQDIGRVPPGTPMREAHDEFVEFSRQTRGTNALGSLDAQGRARNAGGIEAAIRAEFEARAREVADAQAALHPEKRSALLAQGGADFARAIRADIENLTGVAHDVRQAGERLGQLSRARRDFEKSAIARFAERDPDKAIAGIFNAPDPAAAARELNRKLARDPDAVRGLKAGVIEYFLGMGGNRSLMTANRRLAEDTRWGRVFNEVLGPADAERFRTIINDGANLEGGNVNNVTRAAAAGTSMLAGWVGLTVGHLASKLNPSQAGALSYPQQMKRTFQGMAAKAFDSDNPWEMVSRAVLDPKQEALLRSKLPDGVTSGREAARMLRRLFSLERAAFDQAVEAYEKRETGRQ